jgi:hypothetical protein
MSDEASEAADSLDQISIAIMNAVSDDRPFNLLWSSWNLPAINRRDVANIPSVLAHKIRAIPPRSLPEATLQVLRQVPSQVNWIQANTVPNMAGGNAGITVTLIKDFCSAIEASLPPPPMPLASVDWKAAETQKLLPPGLLRRLRSIESSLKDIEPRTAQISDDIRFVTEARSAAEELPTSLADIAEKQVKLAEYQKAATDSFDEIDQISKKSSNALNALNADKSEASLILSKLDEAYRAATTQGLAAAFSKKALNLNFTLLVWIVALATSLGAGAFVVHLRFTQMEVLLMDKNISTDRLWIQAALAALGIGGPIWFAWIATKQIGQRFRMAEDYAYKATVAKAYEGYRLEAVRIGALSQNTELEARLFATAIERLEEAPLRLVDTASHGSPISEFIEHPVFRRALDAVPELREVTQNLVKKALPGRAVEG